MSGPDAPKCFTDAFNIGIQENLKSSSDTLPEDTTIGTASVSPLSFNTLEDRTVAYRAEIPVSAKGFDTALYLDLIFVQQGRVAVILSGQDTITPFPTDMSEELVRRVLARLPAGDASSGSGECVNVARLGDIRMPLATVSSGDSFNGQSAYYAASKSGALWVSSFDPSEVAAGRILPLNDAARLASDIGVDTPPDSPDYGDANAGSEAAQKALACAAKL